MFESVPAYVSPLMEQYADKYSDNPRTDLLGLIGPHIRSVLEIGCGAGATGEAVKRSRPGITYVGVDLEPSAVARARTRLDRAVVANLDHASLEDYDIRKSSFDLIICADILEHLYDPWKTLAVLREYLTPRGELLASIPNIQNIQVIDNLARGFWTYTRYGILDATHIRFFTLNGILKLFEGTGYTIEQCLSKCVPEMPPDATWPRDYQFGNLVIRNVDQHQALQLHTFQYLVLARVAFRGNGSEVI